MELFAKNMLWSDFGGESSDEIVFLSTGNVMEVTVLIRHVKGQLSAPLHADSEVCVTVCMLKPHANTTRVCC